MCPSQNTKITHVLIDVMEKNKNHSVEMIKNVQNSEGWI
jgi:hypothetical protein